MHEVKRGMKKMETNIDRPVESVTEPHRLRLPGFLIDEAGLGDVIKRVTQSMGIRPCGGCEKRAAALNRWVRFSRY